MSKIGQLKYLNASTKGRSTINSYQGYVLNAYYVGAPVQPWVAWTNITAHTIFATPMLFERRVRIDRIGAMLGGATGLNQVRLGIYTTDIGASFHPDTLVDGSDGGVLVAAGAVAWRQNTIDVWLNKGYYWLAYLSNDTTIDGELLNVAGLGILGTLVPGQTLKQSMRAAQVFGPMPLQYPAVAVHESVMRNIMVRVAEQAPDVDHVHPFP